LILIEQTLQRFTASPTFRHQIHARTYGGNEPEKKQAPQAQKVRKHHQNEEGWKCSKLLTVNMARPVGLEPTTF
jgi:hypothetical protein